MPVLRIKEGLGHGKVRSRLHLRVETRNLPVQVISHRVERHTNGKVRLPAKRLSGPIRSLIEPAENFHQAHRIHFVHAARLGIIADRGRIPGDRQNVPHAANGPCSEQHRLQPDNVLIACRQVRNGFHPARLECSGYDQGIHSHARHRSAIDVDGVHLV